MGLHSITKPKLELPPEFTVADEPDEDEEYTDEDGGQCPECGSYSWSIRVYGRYSQWGYYTFGNSHYIDYDGMDSADQDADDGWNCENGHPATEYIYEMLLEV